MSKNNNNKKVTVRPMYFQIDIERNKTKNVTNDGNKLNKCDIVLITPGDFESNNDCDESYFINKTKNWLLNNYPNGDWEYRRSNIGNFVFWKESKLLKSRQETLAFNSAA